MFERNSLRANARRMKIQYSSYMLKTIAIMFTIIGTIGVAVIKNGLMSSGAYAGKTLADVSTKDMNLFMVVTTAVLCSAIAAMALPIYSLILIEGFKKTSSFKNYFIRIAIIAVITEIPYDIAMQDKIFTMESQNPVIGFLVALVMIYFIDRFEATGKLTNFVIKTAIIVAALLWMIMLNVDQGIVFVLVTAVLWILDGQGALRTFVAVIVSLFGLMLSTPIGFVVNHFYNGDKGEGNRKVFYVLYPLQFLIIGIIGKICF
ncbi:MAG: hypothetical protein E7266_02880 [Lachnospiraceae bacterium]|nr:hypothetical protein [Lachnospiraceae bacterium]